MTRDLLSWQSVSQLNIDHIFSATYVWVGLASYRPLKVIIYAAIFQLSYIFWGFCPFFFTFISKRSRMVFITPFEFFFASTIIVWFSLTFLVWFISDLLTCAWYTKYSDKHFSTSGKLDFCQQLNSFCC